MYYLNVKLNNQQFNKFLGKKIKAGRKEMGVRQEELAKRLGFSRIALSTYESGRSKFTVYQLMLTAEILGLPLSFFLPKNTRNIETKTEIPVLNTEKDIEFVLEMALRSYFLHKGTKRSELNGKIKEVFKTINTKLD